MPIRKYEAIFRSPNGTPFATYYSATNNEQAIEMAKNMNANEMNPYNKRIGGYELASVYWKHGAIYMTDDEQRARNYRYNGGK